MVTVELESTEPDNQQLRFPLHLSFQPRTTIFQHDDYNRHHLLAELPVVKLDGIEQLEQSYARLLSLRSQFDQHLDLSTTLLVMYVIIDLQDQTCRERIAQWFSEKSLEGIDIDHHLKFLQLIGMIEEEESIFFQSQYTSTELVAPELEQAILLLFQLQHSSDSTSRLFSRILQSITVLNHLPEYFAWAEDGLLTVATMHSIYTDKNRYYRERHKLSKLKIQGDESVYIINHLQLFFALVSCYLQPELNTGVRLNG